MNASTESSEKKLGLPGASALATFGPISIVAFVLVTIGALALAIVFGWLSKRVPGSGGPYLYARDAFGELAGFLNALSYWITAWAGNAAIVVALTGYVAAGIARRLRRRGLQLMTEPMAFTVDEHHHLESGQQKKAEAWGAELVSRISPAPPLSRDEVGRSTAIVTTEKER